MKFSETDLGVISNALRVAAERFDENTALLAKVDARVADQFKRQAIEAYRIYDGIANQTGIAS
jgi:hypothetical protein